jgi:hypothetical protein
MTVTQVKRQQINGKPVLKKPDSSGIAVDARCTVSTRPPRPSEAVSIGERLQTATTDHSTEA